MGKKNQTSLQISEAPMRVCKCGEVQAFAFSRKEKGKSSYRVCQTALSWLIHVNLIHVFFLLGWICFCCLPHSSVVFTLHPSAFVFSFFPLPSFIFEYFTPLVIKEAFSLYLLDSWQFDLPDRGGTNNITNYRTALIAGAELSMQLVPPFFLL